MFRYEEMEGKEGEGISLILITLTLCLKHILERKERKGRERKDREMEGKELLLVKEGREGR